MKMSDVMDRECYFFLCLDLNDCNVLKPYTTHKSGCFVNQRHDHPIGMLKPFVSGCQMNGMKRLVSLWMMGRIHSKMMGHLVHSWMTDLTEVHLTGECNTQRDLWLHP